MKQVLIIDASQSFFEFIKEKLSDEKVKIDSADSRREAFARMLSLLPDLIIMDVGSSFGKAIDFLKKKFQNVNAASIPLVLIGAAPDARYTTLFAHFNVHKYFANPIDFPAFFSYLSLRLEISCTFDESPTFTDIHVKGDLVCVEVAGGLNRDKILLIKHRLNEIVKGSPTVQIKLLLMFSGKRCTYIDGVNLEYLFDSILSLQFIQRADIKFLSLDPYARLLLSVHPYYNGIETADSIDDLIASFASSQMAGDIESAMDKILGIDSAALRLAVESPPASAGRNEGEQKTFSIAVVDSAIARKLAAAFRPLKCAVTVYRSGKAFLDAVADSAFDLIIIGSAEPDFTCFDLLTGLQAQDISVPVFVYSPNRSLDAARRATAMGAKKYLIAPMAVEDIVRKSISFLRERPEGEP